SQKPLSILISGAGIAGSSLAFMLASHPSFNLKPVVTLVERSTEPRTTGQAIDIRGPAVGVIRQLGLEQKIKERHTTEVAAAFLNSQGKIIAQLDSTGDADKQNATSEFEILRGELAGLLLDEVEIARQTKGAAVNVVYGESIKSLTEQDDGVAVQFMNGKVDAQKFDVVVAADGIFSKTRSMIFGKDDSPDFIKPLGLYVAFFTVPRIEQDDDIWRWYPAAGGLAMHLRPHRSKKTMGVYLSITAPKKERIPEIDEVLTKDINAQKAMIRERFQNVGWQRERFLAAMDSADDFYVQNTSQVKTPQWTRGRSVIVGDAAFAIMGIGTSLAMIGPYVMAGELSKITSNDAAEVAAALQRYEDIFRPYVQKNDTMPPMFPQMMNPQTKMGVRML
ncbi:FAD/NAD(P)-binding domain-containing protein, partial [Dothidotthia symphoricarpi CBS 119687]